MHFHLVGQFWSVHWSALVSRSTDSMNCYQVAVSRRNTEADRESTAPCYVHVGGHSRLHNGHCRLLTHINSVTPRRARDKWPFAGIPSLRVTSPQANSASYPQRDGQRVPARARWCL